MFDPQTKLAAVEAELAELAQRYAEAQGLLRQIAERALFLQGQRALLHDIANGTPNQTNPNN